MNKVYIQGVGVLGPGLSGWKDSLTILTGEQLCEIQPLQLSTFSSLPANERRRASRLSKIAMQVAKEAMINSEFDSLDQASVFASSCGDLDIVDKICSALTMQGKPVSPIQFHNSVHNAQAGYWAIANNIQQASNSISAYTGSFAAGLLEAITYVNIEQVPVLLVVYDRPAPGPLAASAPSQYEFGMAMLLTAESHANAIASVAVELIDSETGHAGLTACRSSVLDKMRSGCPAARALPLLEILAVRETGEVVLPYVNHLHVRVKVECHDT